jgi:hypothetical protein
MTFKKKHFIIIALVSCGLALSVWVFTDYYSKRKAKEQIDNALAQRFDETMDVAFPLLEHYAIVIKDRMDSIEAIARKCKEDTSYSYSDAFTLLWLKYNRTEKARKNYIVMEEYEYFKMTPAIEMLVNSGDKKKKESDAIKNLTLAGTELNEPYRVHYDTLMNVSEKVKQCASDCLEAIEPYRNGKDDIHAWQELVLKRRRP